ncbi:MAG: DUF6090 family protein [bacterium]
MRFIRNIYLKYNPKQYIRHIIIEVIIVAVGILIAFQLDAWKEESDRIDIELKTLMEIRSDLRTDVVDISLNDTIHTEGFNSSEIVLKHLSGKNAYHDSLAEHFFTIMYSYSLFLSHTSAYETLKSRGLETVTNDTLRLLLGELYDVKYELIEKNEMDLRSLIFNDVFTYFKKNFTLDNSEAIPINYNALLRDRYFLNLIALNKLAQRGSASDFRKLLIELKKIDQLLEAEISRLE